jgi:rsbT co-antagonist protein RsbR
MQSEGEGSSRERPKITVEGVDFEWDRVNSQMLIWGRPVACMWIETTLAGLMNGLLQMVGPERFMLATEQAGRESVEGEWEHIIMPQPSVEDGFAFISRATTTVGLGAWELVTLDRENKLMRFRSRNDWESLYQQALGVHMGASTLIGKFGAYGTKLFGTYCRGEQVAFTHQGAEFDEFVVRPSSRTVEDDLEDLLATEKATRADLTAALERLRAEIDERQRIEDELRAKLDVIRAQEEAIRQMSTPILRLWDGVLTMPVIGIVDKARATAMMENLLQQITQTHARFAILDLTGVGEIDADAAGHLLALVSAARLLGTRCLVSGISPATASTLVSLEVQLGELETFGTLEAALRRAIQARHAEG